MYGICGIYKTEGKRRSEGDNDDIVNQEVRKGSQEYIYRYRAV